MKDAALDLFKQLTSGLPAYLKGVILVLIVVCTSLYFMGFNPESIKSLFSSDHEITESSIKLSNKIDKDDSDIIESVSHQIFKDVDEIIGVAIFELSPTLSPRVLKVITRDGSNDFENFFKIGREFHIGSTVPTMYGSIRQGFPYVNDTDDHHWLCDLKCESVISVAIMYRNVCVGNIIVFLEKKLDKYSDYELKYIIGNISNQSINIVEQLYFK